MQRPDPREKSGVARCQRCLKYGHYTYECKNEVAYRYRPSRTVQYKQQLKMDLKKSKPPKTNIVNPDYKRRVVEEGPSSDSEDYNPKKTGDKNLKIQTLQEQSKKDEAAQVVVEKGQGESSSSSDSSSNDSSSSSSNSSDSSESQEPAPRKYQKK